jgi:hypothetical protein
VAEGGVGGVGGVLRVLLGFVHSCPLDVMS